MSFFFEPQPLVCISPESGIHAGKSLTSEVVEESQTTFKIKLPYSQGKLTPLPVGTLVEIRVPGGQMFFSEVVGKLSAGSSTFLELLLPYQLTKRNRLENPKIVAITSGKGGVGKTTFLINTAVALSELGLRVCIVDADLGTANIDVLLNLNPRYSIKDVVQGQKTIMEVLLEGPNHTIVVPGSSGFQPLTNVTEAQVQRLFNSLGLLEPYVDIILVDTCPGVSRNVMCFNRFSDEIVVITTPEPHAIADAYATLKVMTDVRPVPLLRLAVNMVENSSEGTEIAERIIQSAQRFLSLEISGLGSIEYDAHVPASVKRLTPCITKYPDSPASRSYRKVAGKLITPPNDSAKSGSLLKRLRQITTSL